MTDEKLTAQQQSAVDARASALLVSAAAGSGKTKVLVERLMSYLTDETDPANIDEFLIITFTRAAAAELRMKIRTEINHHLSLQPENRHLQKQLNRLPAAQISTVHAFCSALLRQYAVEADIPSDFRVAEPQQTASIADEAMEEALQTVYDRLQEDTDYAAMVEEIGYGRSDRRLRELILTSYERIRCHPNPKTWMEQCLASYEMTDETLPEQTVWGAYWIESLHETAAGCIAILREAIGLGMQDEDLTEKYVPVFERDIEMLQSLADAATWDGCREKLQIGFEALKPVRKCSAPECKERMQAQRALVKDLFKKYSAAFYADSKKVLSDLKKTVPAIRGFLALVQVYDKAYHARMKARKLFDYSDLEQYTIGILTERTTGKSTALAREISGRYREILVDEYQDSNAVQECIYQAVSRNGENLFMVGDIKQSIYGFRLADPSIFLKKYQTFLTLEKPVEDHPRKVLLSCNFRSREEILEAANDVFSIAMTKDSGGLDYAKTEKLRAGREFPSVTEPRVELLVMDTGRAGDEEENLSAGSKVQQEAALVAARIHRILQEKTMVTDKDGLRPAEPKDIVILMRAPGLSVPSYQQALAKYRIPCISNRSGSILQTAEVEILMQMLRTIDNPHHEIELVGVMASPVFCIQPEQLAMLRGTERESDLYDCLLQKKDSDPALGAFADWLEQMRGNVAVMPLQELVQEVIDSTHYDDLCSALPDGTRRVENLRTFCAFAADCSESQLMSLSRFNSCLQDMLAHDQGLEAAGSAQNLNAVQIMSTHQSKGLEFPIVILADLLHRFNTTDSASGVLLDDTLGLGGNVVDLISRTYYPSLARMAIAHSMKQKMIAEEMRILYVAMTRAKDMLIMSVCGADLFSKLEKLKSRLVLPMPGMLNLAVNCPADWILTAALCRTEAGTLFERVGPSDVSSVSKMPWKIEVCEGVQDTGERETGALENAQHPEGKYIQTEPYQSQTYAYLSATKLPSKMTATQLKGRSVDLEAAEQTVQTVQHHWEGPSFLQEKPLTGTERGNATHLFMQFARYASCTTKEAITAELHRMLAGKYLSARQAEAVDTEKIMKLFTSPFGQRILSAEEPEREFKFSIFVPANELLPTDCTDEIMLQGVVDCFWEEADGLVIVDFKTDRVGNDPSQRAIHYAPQLQSYAKALHRIWQKNVKECYLYFFDANMEVPVEI